MTGENESASATAEITAPELAAEVGRLVAAEGWKSAAKLIEQHWDRFIVADSQHLLAAIKTLPSEALMETPHLLVAVNYLQHISTGRDPRFFHNNPQLAAGADEGGDGSVLDRLIANTGKVASLRTAGRLESAVTEVELGRRILDEAPEDERDEIARSLAHFVFQWERTLDLALDAQTPGFLESFELAVDTQQHALVRRSAASLAWQHADRGRLTEATRWIEVAKASDRPNPRYDAPLHLAEALVCLDRRDHEGAARALAELDAVESGEYWAAEIWVRTVGTESASDAVRVEESLEREQGRHPAQLVESGANLRYVTLTRLALGLLMHYPALVPGATSMQSLPWVQLAHGFRAYLAGDWARALDATGRVIGAEQAPRLRSTALLLCAWALAGRGDLAESEVAFETAHALITEEGLLRVYAVLGGADLAELAARSGLPVPEEATKARGAATSGDGGATVPGGSSELLHLTKREREILIALCGEQTMPEIAVANFITLNTLKATVRAVYAKLGVHSRREAVDVAFRAGLG